MPTDDSVYMPVLVGATKNWNDKIDYQRDDDGVNISDKNPNYNELTAIYWAWKNIQNADVIGLVHYRRFFFKKFKKRKMQNVLTKTEFENLFHDVDLILPRKRKYYVETNYDHYIHAHHKEPLDMTRKVVAALYPDYLNSFDSVMHCRSAHMFNMFVMKKKLFDEYCEWLFDILQNVSQKIDIQNYSLQEKRVFGYLSELLLDVWVQTNGIKYKQVRWGMLGKSHTLKKIFFLFKRKFGRKTQTHF